MMARASLIDFKYGVIFLPFFLVACGGDSKNSNSPPQKPATVKEARQNMGSSGPAPLFERTTSVTGPDSNANGIRDDVEKYITTTSYTADQKLALGQLSKAMTLVLTSSPSDESSLRRATAKMNDAVACIWSRFPEDKANAAVLEMRKVTVNTKERYDAYMSYNAAVAGTVVKLQKEVKCD